jgi:hypothetical protein
MSKARKKKVLCVNALNCIHMICPHKKIHIEQEGCRMRLPCHKHDTDSFSGKMSENIISVCCMEV